MRSVALIILIASAACSESPTNDGRSLVVIRDPQIGSVNVQSRNAAFVTALPQLQSVLDRYGPQPDAIPPFDDVQQEAAAAAVRDDDPYRINGSILADTAS